MAVLRKSQVIDAYNSAQSTLISDGGEKSYSSTKLLELARTFDSATRYDIFLSHSFDDARIVRQIRNMLTDAGLRVYVDWIDDKHLSRQTVSAESAHVIKRRMNTCSSLIYLTSTSAEQSVWMPWELGYMDARTGRVAVAPLLEDEEQAFQGREYLALYPYLDLTSGSFYIHSDPLSWVSARDWLSGKEPSRRM